MKLAAAILLATAAAAADLKVTVYEGPTDCDVKVTAGKLIRRYTFTCYPFYMCHT